MELRRYQTAEQDEQRNIAALQELGVEVVSLSDAEHQKMREKVRQTVWPQLRKDIGQPFDDVVQFVEQNN
jgi:TRAP-type C4-dicarboxylate transport system substrate-binding protein